MTTPTPTTPPTMCPTPTPTLSVRQSLAARRQQRARDGLPSSGPNERSRRALDQAVRRAHVMELRLLGYRSSSALARELRRRYGLTVHRNTCWHDLVVVEVALRAAAGRDREIEKGRQLEQVQAMLAPIFPQAVAGSLVAIDRCIALLRLEASLLGTLAPIAVRTFDPVEIACQIAVEEGLSPAEAVAIAEAVLRLSK